ncbi:DUF2182 domain-containing protein [Mucilaginibacter endophyticus]|uniref:copper chaperone n=1 Tax=Mucilaginibacter endophyticus TaxID=2675003 RepID=UPI00137B66A7|nr:DUF2182 domain-containing protein [Mucilaginibacter endophyticus]
MSATCWGLLLVKPAAVKHCFVTGGELSRTSLEILLLTNPISPMLAGWGLMVLAMMLPKLIIPIQYTCERSFKNRRFRAASLFVLGYMGVWMVVGALMIGGILGLTLFMPGSYTPAIVVGIIAAIWQFSPVKQQCLNRGHNHKALAAFGRAADYDSVLFGFEHAVWCVGSNWVLMLFPVLLPGGNNFVMLAVTLLMLSEHMEAPRTPRWRINLSSKLIRILFAQTSIRLARS